ncbi:FUSC family protein [Flavivirga jejuensis]|uniref:FUSC family protein n=1 Tax=Flavivirga jejuensis TaxID=870487 RepID=A0ABT8WLD7_9FLAO|nr:FUSC family protein [Flavivirga jejuensis]MDO5973971.1 FUSC family protein [Flavivirga jejuensis]
MKKTFIFLAITASVLAIILLALFIYYLGIIPSFTGLAVGLLAFILLKKRSKVKKIIQFSISLTVMALTISTCKSIFNKTEITNTNTKLEEEKDRDEDEESKNVKIENIDLTDKQ